MEGREGREKVRVGRTHVSYTLYLSSIPFVLVSRPCENSCASFEWVG